MATLFAQESDERSPDRFRADVEKWRAEAKEALDEVVTEFLRYHLARGRLLLRNKSDRYLEGVRVQVQFPPDVVVLMGSDTAYHDHSGQFEVFQLLPERPQKYGTLQRYGIAHLAGRYGISAPVSAAMPPFDVEETSDGYRITWDVGDLPSRWVETGDELFAVITDAHVEEVVATWSVTARGVHHVFRGDVSLPCEQAPDHHLRWSRHRAG